MTAVGFIGLGNMGAPMARHLIANGYDVRVYDVSEASRAIFGERARATAAEAVRGADLLVTMLPNGQIVRDVLVGAGNALREASKGLVVVDTSSSGAEGTVALGRELAARGVALIDAPVSGGVVLAGEGKLAMMIGHDDPAALAKARPLLETLGARIIEVGGLGAGHAAKAINNAIAAANIAIAAEGLVLASRFGVDPATLLEVVNASTGRSAVTETIFKTQILTREFRQGFAIGLMSKDVTLAATLGDSLGLALPQLAATESSWAQARDALGAGADFTAFIRFIEGLNETPAAAPTGNVQADA